ncbi:MAG: type II toxin-antitoxin system RelE/ParE family toxin [Vicinamibacterales bacterium]
MAEIAWTAEAQRWLKDIHEYIATDNPDAAHRTVSAIHERAQILLTFPQVGHRYRDDRDIRILLYGHYRIAYLIKPNRDIDVLGVFHGSLEIERYLT